MITIKLFLIQIFAIIAILLMNSVILFTFYNYNIIALLPLYKEFIVPIHAIFATLFGIYIFVSNLGIPFIDYNDVEMDIDDAISYEVGIITSHLIQSAALTLLLVLFMALFA